MMLKWSLVILLILTASSTLLAKDQHLAFKVQDQNPFALIYGLPRYSTSTIQSPSQSHLDLSFEISSNFAGDRDGQEFIRIDGENTRMTLRYVRGFDWGEKQWQQGWEWGVELPWITHNGGSLDGFIFDWHKFFGLDQSGRNLVANDQLLYNYSVGGVEQFLFTNNSSGVGDMSLLLGKQLSNSEHQQTALRSQLKLPTGDSSKLTGSGATDFNFSIYHNRAIANNFWWSTNAGASYLGRGDILSSQQRQWAATLGTGLNWQVSKPITLRLQLDMHTALYDDTELDPLAKPAYVFSFGGRIQMGRLGTLDLAVIEDVPNSGVAPDVGFHLSWSPRLSN